MYIPIFFPNTPKEAPFPRCLSLDLEVGVKDSLIKALAGVRPDTGQSLSLSVNRQSLADGLSRLDALADGAEFIIGHNIMDFDLPHLRAANPNLRLLQLPVVDTLRINPLAFPRNPYHHLVKHYQDGQLKRGRINDPKLDAELTLDVFKNQLDEFEGAPWGLLAAWHWLTANQEGDGFDIAFRQARQSERPADDVALDAIQGRIEHVACITATQEILAGAGHHGWPLAYALAWIHVSGGNSVMPPWVGHQFPEAGALVRKLRDTACTDPSCEWCRENHDATKQLKRWFGFSDFRAEPIDEDSGHPMQQSITEAAMAGEHVLGILPTGAGKSVCYQVPALSRYDKTGALTVVISPLVALMADQVAGMQAHDIDSCVTVNGLLSMPERSDALDRVRLGDASILLISPEQLRSVSVDRALQQREIGMWVLDEAHCLSRWGHDFRPDYRYVGRYIRKRAGKGPVPPVLCLTATAKPDVVSDIVDYFRKEIDIKLRVFNGGARRTNIDFVVVQTTPGEKFEHIYQVLETDLPPDEPGGAIVYCATRRHTEEVARFLRDKGVRAEFFHAGLPPETKKNVQRSFIKGDLQVIVATNAFGMGIDKPDVRLVIHADIPGSLENYLQEAGRAGRDEQMARCVLLYTEEDVERQFSMAAHNRLTRREIHGVLRALRNMDRKKRLNGRIVATTGEILLEDDEHAFQRDANTDDTRARTAVAWLEESVLLTREENRVQVFPSSLRVNTLDEAQEKLNGDTITGERRRQLLRIAESLFNADPDDGISTDELMLVGGLSPEGVQAALHDLEQLGIASNDTTLTAFVHSGVQRASRERFAQAAALEEAIIQLMQESASDMEVGESHPLHLRQFTQQLKDQGYSYALPELVRRIIRSIAADGRGEGSGRGSLGVRSLDRDTLRITLLRDWSPLAKTAELRRTAAERLLDHFLNAMPPNTRGTDILVETTLGKLQEAIKADMVLMSDVKNPVALMNLALLWLHEQEIIRLNRGLTIFRPAMTIQLQEDRRGFANPDFEPLKIHYDEQTQQVHVMTEYVQRGLERMADAVRLAMDYFSLRRDEFIRRWLPNREEDLARQTTPASWDAIVESLNNPNQRRIVADEREQTNVLVLAGPGSGKTRVLVHRIAYLIRVRRENPRSILALSYNRHAAIEIRRRLQELIGDDARGVMVMTCHALAMRLTGASFSGRSNNPADIDFRGIVREAAGLLRGEGLPPDDADEYRSRLLAGFRWILVDEYQDVERDQYDLISALAGRTLAEEDDKLSLFAVGDDDQNIYSFNGASVEFIRRFEEDYGAKPVYLTDNYRSTGHIIAAANAIIEPSQNRMKTGHPIRVNRARRGETPGGEWAQWDPVGKGRVQILPVGDSPISQAQTIVSELKRLSGLSPEWDWSKCAVIARDWRFLDPIRSLCELEGIPVQMANEDFTGIWRLRESQALVTWLNQKGSDNVTAKDIRYFVGELPKNPWAELLAEAIEEYALETGGAETPVAHAIEWLAEWSREARRRQRGLLLSTAHRAKGLEFDHVVVLDGEWDRIDKTDDKDAQRRLYYVAMTRARKTLTLARLSSQRHPFHDALPNNPAILWRDPLADLPPGRHELERRYIRLSLRDVFLSFAGYRPPTDKVHRAIAALSPGDPLQLRFQSYRWELVDSGGTVVGRLSGSFSPPVGMRCSSATVMAIVSWDKGNSTAGYQPNLQCDEWEVVVPELVFEPDIQQLSVEPDAVARSERPPAD